MYTLKLTLNRFFPAIFLSEQTTFPTLVYFNLVSLQGLAITRFSCKIMLLLPYSFFGDILPWIAANQ